MNLTSKMQTAVSNPSKIPPYAYRQVSKPVRLGLTKLALRRLDSQKRLLDDVRDREEYLIVVLDACRWDMYNEHAQGLFDQRAQPVASEGHDTFQYAARCWDDYYPDVTYVSGATPIGSTGGIDFDDEGLRSLYQGYRPEEHIPNIVDVWDTHWDPALGTVPPEAVAEETIKRVDQDKLVCHLFQPHAPYIGEPKLLGHTNDDSAIPREGEPIDAPLWRDIHSGRIPTEELREAYRGNLKRALDTVCWLLRETAREVVIIGDHGEALGELGTYSHPRQHHPKIRTVPYAEVKGLTPRGTSGAQRAARRLEESSEAAAESASDVKGKLESLGYL